MSTNLENSAVVIGLKKSVFILILRKWKWSCSVASNSLRPLDCSPPNSSVHGILQARILEWVAISLSFSSRRPHLKDTQENLIDQSSSFPRSQVEIKEADKGKKRELCECEGITLFHCVFLYLTYALILSFIYICCVLCLSLFPILSSNSNLINLWKKLNFFLQKGGSSWYLSAWK